MHEPLQMEFLNPQSRKSIFPGHWLDDAEFMNRNEIAFISLMVSHPLI